MPKMTGLWLNHFFPNITELFLPPRRVPVSETLRELRVYGKVDERFSHTRDFD